MMIKRFTAPLLMLFVSASLYAQTVNYEQRYDLLVSKLGPAGVGIETVLDNWAKTDSTNARLLTARFNYYFNKAQSSQVVTKRQNRYLGMNPLLSLKDSTGNDVYYYQETFFDDEIYGQAIKAADKAISMRPDDIDFRFMKANAYISYEKESPDMALAYLLDLADMDAARNRPWNFEGKKAESGFFADAMQEYCYSFYTIGSPEAMKAFLQLSEKMLSLNPGSPLYLNNIGSYRMIADKDYKGALKCYDKVLKKHPDDYTAIKNSIVASRKLNNSRLERKYLQMMVKYGPDNEKRQAEARLTALTKK